MTQSLARPSSPLTFPQSGSLHAVSGFQELGLVNPSFSREHDLKTAVKAVEPAKHFAPFPPTHGDPFGSPPRSATRIPAADGQSGLPLEAMGKPESLSGGGLCQTLPDSKNDTDKLPSYLATDAQSLPNDINREPPDCLERKISRKVPRGRSFSTDFDRDAAWEHKRELYLMGCEAADTNMTQTRTAASRRACDTGHKTWSPPAIKSLPRTRTWSLTDEDLEELRGSIDLGFGFSNDESYDLKITLPALELYYAINRQYAEAKSHSPSVSPLDGTTLRRTCSADSPGDASREILRICSPGDHPSQVKTRLRHWAQAVACSIKQGYEGCDTVGF